MRRIEELCAVSAARGIPRYSGFLSDREQSLARAAVNRAGCLCTHFWGGYEGAERQILCVEPPDSWQEMPVAVLCIRAIMADKPPTHRDYLGSILGLGLDRACLGDLVLDPAAPETAYAFVLEDKAGFIIAELTSAGRCSVRTERCERLPERLLQGPERELREATVASLRADSVLAAMLHTSRTRAAEYIAAGRVELNHLPVRGAHETVYEQDIITVRGVGRYRLAAVGGKSRKDRIFISYYQY